MLARKSVPRVIDSDDHALPIQHGDMYRKRAQERLTEYLASRQRFFRAKSRCVHRT